MCVYASCFMFFRPCVGRWYPFTRFQLQGPLVLVLSPSPCTPYRTTKHSFPFSIFLHSSFPAFHFFCIAHPPFLFCIGIGKRTNSIQGHHIHNHNPPLCTSLHSDSTPIPGNGNGKKRTTRTPCPYPYPYSYPYPYPISIILSYAPVGA